jgi:hypothetical protein
MKLENEVEELRQIAIERWGDVNTTADVLFFDDDSYEITIFHTFFIGMSDSGIRSRPERLELRKDTNGRVYESVVKRAESITESEVLHRSIDNVEIEQ